MTDSGNENIIVELGTISEINHIKLLLWDRDKRSYSYCIETSVDQSSWNRVIDFTEYYCRSWQFLFFPSQAVRYIKIVGTRNTENSWFQAVALQAYYTAKVPTLLNGLISPTYNVATTDKGAVVIEGVKPDVLLNGDVKKYCTYHIIGKEKGTMIVRLIPKKSYQI